MLPLIGDGVDRADGRLKVTGGAKYAAEFAVPDLCHAVLVPAGIAKGRVADIDVAAAERMPGVLAVLCYKNADDPLRHVPPAEPNGSSQSPGAHHMLTDQVIFYGQHIAVVVAQTLEQARHAADTLRVTYADQQVPFTDVDAGLGHAKPPKSGKAKDEPADTHRGDPDGAYAAAPVKVRNVYGTPHETHNPMEMHATTAAWGADGKLTLWDATQGVDSVKASVGTALGLQADQVRTINPFVGGGFGCKGSTWPHVALTALAARVVNRPVRMMLTRSQMFTDVGYRSPTRQTIALAAEPRRDAGIGHTRLGLADAGVQRVPGDGRPAHPQLVRLRQRRQQPPPGHGRHPVALPDAGPRRVHRPVRLRGGHGRAGRRPGHGPARPADEELRDERP